MEGVVRDNLGRVVRDSEGWVVVNRRVVVMKHVRRTFSMYDDSVCRTLYTYIIRVCGGGYFREGHMRC